MKITELSGQGQVANHQGPERLTPIGKEVAAAMPMQSLLFKKKGTD